MNSVLAYVCSFRFINFIWMTCCGIYAFNRWAAPGLRHAIKEQKLKLSQLKKSIEVFILDTESVHEEIKQQAHQEQKILAKLHLWNQHVKDLQKINLQNQNNFLHQYRIYKAQQTSTLRLIYAQQVLKKDILENVVKTTHKLFTDEKQQQLFMRKALQGLKD